MYQGIRLDLASLRIYRNILEDAVIKKLITALENASKLGSQGLVSIDSFNDFVFELFKSQRTFKEHIIYLILHDDNPFSQLAEKQDLFNMDELIIEAVKGDLRVLKSLYYLDFIPLFNSDINKWQDMEVKGIEFNPDADWADLVGPFAKHYKTNSRGLVSLYKGFYWDRNLGLKGIENLQKLSLEDLIACDWQIEKIKANTEKFLQRKPANNILLYGPRGTGKSTAIKALLNEYQDGLRIVEIAREDLDCIPQVVSVLKDYNLRFILFLDDLSFEDYETDYKGLKAVLEGSLAETPSNVLIYATSNRRHLVKEYFSDRARPSSEEIHAQDTMQEKLSLADRFGLTITFPAINKKTYLDIVRYLVDQENIKIDGGLLEELALEWERSHHGPSGRTARQFVNSLGK